jgi:hypothetical protein
VNAILASLSIGRTGRWQIDGLRHPDSQHYGAGCAEGRPTRPTNPRRAFNDDEFLLPKYP